MRAKKNNLKKENWGQIFSFKVVWLLLIVLVLISVVFLLEIGRSHYFEFQKFACESKECKATDFSSWIALSSEFLLRSSGNELTGAYLTGAVVSIAPFEPICGEAANCTEQAIGAAGGIVVEEPAIVEELIVVEPAKETIAEEAVVIKSATETSAVDKPVEKVAASSMRIMAVPTHSTPILNTTNPATNDTSTNLTAYNVSTADTDGDLVKNIYNWYRNGTSITILNLPFEGGSLDGTPAPGVANGVRDYARNINGTVVNATWNATGGYDGRGAYEFDGNGYIILPPSTLTNYTALTFAAWINPKNGQGDASADDFQIINSAGHTSYLWQIDRPDNLTELLLGGITAGVDRCSQLGSGFPVLPDRWTHVAITWNNVTGCRYYVNGTLAGSAATTIGQVQWGGSVSERFVIGAYRSNWPLGFANGTIDEVMIFNRSLSAQQIHALYNNRTDLIARQELRGNDMWSVQITPNDGSADGDTLQSNNVTIFSSPPLQIMNIPSINLTVGAYITINLSNYFTDTDGDGVNFTAPDAALITISADNTTKILAINATANGTVTANITATDGFLTTLSNNFTVYINPAPEGERWSDVFVGPLGGWRNVTDYFGAVGDGVTNDTAAFQYALDNLSNGDFTTLYIPAGTYRITNTLKFPKYANDTPATQLTTPTTRIFGEDPNTTTLIWDGNSGEPMIFLNPCWYDTIGRLTLDGNRTALSGIQHGWFYGNTCKFQDLVFQDFEYGIEAGYNKTGAFGVSDYLLFRNKFLRNTKAGIIMSNSNTLGWAIWGSYFKDNNYSITNYFPGHGSSTGNMHVYESIFENSTNADVWIGSAGEATVRDCYSKNSNSFFITSGTNSPRGITLQRNLIIDSKGTPISIGDKGPLILLDNVFRGREDFTGPVVYDNVPYVNTTMLSINNTFTVSNQIQTSDDTPRVRQINDRILPRTAIVDLAPELPPSPPKISPPVFEVPTGASDETIQRLINNATNFSGQHPVIHLQDETYYLDSTLVIPASTDLIIVGEGRLSSSTLTWDGKDTGPVIRIEGPSNATLIDFAVNNDNKSIGIVINGVDQEDSKVHLTQIDSTGDIPYLINGLENASIEMMHPAATTRFAEIGVGLKVIGSGRTQTSRVNVFTGGVARGRAFVLKNNGWLAVYDFWDETAWLPLQFFNLTQGSGNLTIATMTAHHCRSTDPNEAQILVNDFNGTVAIINMDLRGDCEAYSFFTDPHPSFPQTALDGDWRTDPGITIKGDNDNLKFALIGNYIQGLNHINNTSPNAQVSEIYSITSIGSNYTETADSGDNSTEFLLSMFSQMRKLNFIFNREAAAESSNVKVESLFISTSIDEGLILSNSFCGNGKTETNEECDDNNSVTGLCAYGQTSCTVCNSVCLNITGDTQICGDGTCNLNYESAADCPADCGVICPSSGINGWWPGENNANDSFFNNHGTLHGDTAFTTGKVGQAFSFDGNGDYVDLDDPLDGTLDFGARNFSISAWWKVPLGIATDIGLVTKDGTPSANGDGYTIRLLTGGSHIYTYINDGVNGDGGSGSGEAFDWDDGNWHHLGWVIDRSTNLSHLYVDGNELGTADDISAQGNIDSASNLLIGAWQSYWNMNGSIDEVILWNRTLNASEVAEIYNAGSAGLCNIPSFTIPKNTSANFRNSQNFSANITLSNNDLDYYIFSTNASGRWVNTTVDISGLQNNASESAMIGLTEGNQICWYYWANNTIGSSARSPTYCFTVQSTPAASSGGGGGAAPSISPTKEEVKITAAAGETKVISFTKDIGITNIEITAAKALASVSVTAESIAAADLEAVNAGKPSETAGVYKYVKITAGTSNENIEKAEIKFKIPLSWFSSNYYDKEKVTLYHYDSGWRALTTEKAGKDSSYAYYEAETTGFSLFAIAAERIAEEKAEPLPTSPAEEEISEPEIPEEPSVSEETAEISLHDRMALAGRAFYDNLSSKFSFPVLSALVFVLLLILIPIYSFRRRKQLILFFRKISAGFKKFLSAGLNKFIYAEFKKLNYETNKRMAFIPKYLKKRSLRKEADELLKQKYCLRKSKVRELKRFVKWQLSSGIPVKITIKTLVRVGWRKEQIIPFVRAYYYSA